MLQRNNLSTSPPWSWKGMMVHLSWFLSHPPHVLILYPFILLLFLAHRYVGADLLSNLSQIARPLTQSIIKASSSFGPAAPAPASAAATHRHCPDASAAAVAAIPDEGARPSRHPGRVFSLLERCVGASSTDREEERPDNTILVSPCYITMRRFTKDSSVSQLPLHQIGMRCQFYCGCAQGQPCYWSSRGVPQDNGREIIRYQLHSSTSLVTSFCLTPYQAFWHRK